MHIIHASPSHFHALSVHNVTSWAQRPALGRSASTRTARLEPNLTAPSAKHPSTRNRIGQHVPAGCLTAPLLEGIRPDSTMPPLPTRPLECPRLTTRPPPHPRTEIPKPHLEAPTSTSDGTCAVPSRWSAGGTATGFSGSPGCSCHGALLFWHGLVHAAG